MPAATQIAAYSRSAEEAERRWFYGGGTHTWLATAEDTGGAFLFWEDQLDAGKVTPLHTHPSAEALYVVEGSLLVHLDGEVHVVATGGFALAPAGVPHAFKVTSDTARVLFLHSPGSCQAFYLGASEPIAPGAGDPATSSPGLVDFGKVQESARLHGGIEILGPPPFAP